jgi:hypothetical protein
MSSPNPPLQPCVEELNDSKIAVRRDGRRATFDNAGRAVIKRVDLDCWLSSLREPRADYILAKPNVVDVIIELKGKDIAHAAEQIVATLGRWKTTPPFSKKIGGLIVFTRCPMSAADLGDMKKRLLKSHGLWTEIDKDQKTEYRFETFAGMNP